MKNIHYKNIRTFLICVFLLLFSLSCDETEPSAPDNPDLNYTLIIETEVESCSIVGCIEDEDGISIVDEAYNANVIAPSNLESSWYHLLFRIQLSFFSFFIIKI